MERGSQIDHYVDLTRKALIHIESQLKVTFQRGGRFVAVVKLGETDTKPLMGDGEVALVIGTVGLDLGSLGEDVNKAAVAGHRLGGKSQCGQRRTFMIDE
ncbi:MAG: hypothetical protein ACRDTG_04815 [Pseudonocardiaceae bacterium]